MPWIIINAFFGVASTVFLFWYAFSHANGKKWIRVLSATIVLYFAIQYTLVMLGDEPESMLPLHLRPFLWLLYLLPVYDSIGDGFPRKKNNKT